MKITLTDAANAKNVVTLASGAGNVDPTGPESLTVSTSREHQADDGIRAVEKLFNDRLNRATSLSFKTHYEFDNLSDAEAFALDWDSQVPSSGTLTIVTDKQGSSVTRQMSSCMVASVAVTLMGVTAFVSYRLVGTPITMI